MANPALCPLYASLTLKHGYLFKPESDEALALPWREDLTSSLHMMSVLGSLKPTPSNRCEFGEFLLYRNLYEGVTCRIVSSDAKRMTILWRPPGFRENELILSVMERPEPIFRFNMEWVDEDRVFRIDNRYRLGSLVKSIQLVKSLKTHGYTVYTRYNKEAAIAKPEIISECFDWEKYGSGLPVYIATSVTADPTRISISSGVSRRFVCLRKKHRHTDWRKLRSR